MKQLFFRKSGRCVALALALALAGCGGMFDGKKIDYKSSGKTKPLEIPPDLAAPGDNSRFQVPDAAGAAPATYSEYEQQRAGKPVAPTTSGVLPTFEKARFERGGSQRWLVVKGAPEQLWPVVKEFWQESGFLIESERPAVGIMETDWAENRAKIPVGGLTGLINRALDFATSSPERDKFRTRLERGATSGTTEIYVSHKGVTQVIQSDRNTSSTPTWTQRPPDPELEAEFLGRLAVRLGVADKAQATAMVKAADKAPPKASVVRSGNATSLTLSDGFDRAWRRVGLALDRIGFMVEDRNREDGTYFVRYQDPDAQAAKKGALSKLAFWRSDDGKKGPEQYRVRVTGPASAGPTEVKVLNKDGAPDNGDTAKRILTLLAEQLQ
jgi:outer membrane protein assembly factor BamC